MEIPYNKDFDIPRMPLYMGDNLTLNNYTNMEVRVLCASVLNTCTV